MKCIREPDGDDGGEWLCTRCTSPAEQALSRQATAWVIKLQGADDAQRREFVGWLKTSPRHVYHYLKTKAVEQGLLDLARAERRKEARGAAP
jgi:ferric-dicitrate binding protein FerR (iron transport regulator)